MEKLIFFINFEFLKIFHTAITVGALQVPRSYNAASAIFADVGKLIIVQSNEKKLLSSIGLGDLDQDGRDPKIK